MTVTKKRLLSMVKSLPHNINIDDLIERLYLEKKLELAEQDISAGRTLSHKKMYREMQKWFR